ncbi:hypothetical protein HDV01_007692 [Terramyces sp. JEL0728]|nr:hypothetical protein HDV01_007692 [Terramyces sp. JEL0728]
MKLLLIGLALAQPGNFSTSDNGFACNPQVCKNSCCSQYGWCGVSTDHCGIGCQQEYGKCDTGMNSPPPLGGPKPTSTQKPMPQKVFAPYIDVTMADLDLAYIYNLTNTKYFNLAFITADSHNQPSWGGQISMDSNLYMKNIKNLRQAGGDVIVSFGGAVGAELATKYTNETDLMYKYARVVEKYSLKWIDFDIEGEALSDLDSSIIRAKALYLLKQHFPKIKISFTLPVDTAGFEANVIALLQATKMYIKLDVINLMTMDYGVNGDMGDFAIQAASNAITQVTKIFYNTTLGITPMIGQNDYSSEIFTLANAKKVLDFSAKTDYISYIGFWSLNRDNGGMKGLGLSSMIAQDNYAFSKIFSQFGQKKAGFLATTSAPIPIYKPTVIQPANGVTPSSCGATGGNYACGGNYCCSQFGYCGTSAGFCGAGCQWSYGTCTGTPPPAGPPPNAPAIPSKFLAPYVDIMAFPTPEIYKFATNAGTKWFVLAFIIADGSGNPAWGGQTAITSPFYLINIQYLRNMGGDVCVSFGGYNGAEIATVTTDITKLQQQYQNVIDKYNVRWLDFDIEGNGLSNTAAIDRRSQALAKLKAANPGLYISITLPALPSGLTSAGLYVVQSAQKYGLAIDVLNIMAMDYGGASVAPDGANGMGKYGIQAAQNTYTQVVALGFNNIKIGITPMIGVNDVAGEIFTLANAQEVFTFAQSTSWVQYLSFWSMQRDTSVNGPLYQSSQISQADFAFSNIFNKLSGTSSPVVQPPVAPVKTTAAPVVQPTAATNPATNPPASSGSCPSLLALPQSPNTLPTGNLYVGYYESWADPTASLLCQVPSYYNVVILSFVDPMMQYTKGSYDISKTGLDFIPSAAGNLKKGIAILRSRGARVIVSAGGWCFSVDGDATCNAMGITPSQTRWAIYDPKDSRYNAARVTQSLQAMRAFVDDFGLDGVDVDFETNGYPSNMNSQANCAPSNGGGSWVAPGTTLSQTCKADTQYINIVNQYRSAFPKPYLISSAVHGYGAFGEGAYDNVHMAAGWCGCWWNGGMAIGMLKASGTKLDFLNVMSYDSNTYWSPSSKTYIVNPNNNNVNVGFYDPTLALLSYQKYFTGPIILGVEPPMEGYPKDSPTTPCKLGHCLTVAELQYLLGFITSHKGGGIMIWAIQKQPESQYAAYPDPNAISSIVCQYFGFSNCGAKIPLGVQAATGPAPITTTVTPPKVTNPPVVVIPPVATTQAGTPSTTNTPSTPSTQTGKLSVANKNFAPYCDILLYPTFDINAVNVATGTRFFTLAFIQAGTSGNPAWGGIVDIKQLFYLDKITTLRNNGGDVIISFGGASGTELAHVTTNVATLQSQYQSVLTLYKANYIDFDIEGSAGDDTAAIDRRHKALAALKAANPGLIISVTLPVLPSGLVSQGINILKNAVANKLQYDVINIMTMDYGSGVAPDGANSMGTYSIQAAQNTYKQGQQCGMTNFKVGLTPMIGNNDVAGEVFTLANAQQVLTFAQTTSWVGLLAFWSINRDTSKGGALYASSGITQNDFDFAKIFNKVSTSSQIPSPVQQSTSNQPANPPAQSTQLPTAPTPPIPVQPDTSYIGRYIWNSKIFAPYVDVSATPTFDVANMKYQVGSGHYILAYITAGTDKAPAWGGTVPLSQNWYFDEIQTIRKFGGEPIITFGGPKGTELANVVTDANTLQMHYQNVIDAYSVEWINFEVGTDSNAVIDFRNQVLRTMQVIDPNLRVSFSLPVTPSGFTTTATYILQSAINYGVRIDFVLLLTMNFGSTLAPNGATAEGGYVIQAASNCFKQVQTLGLNTKLGIVPMIGKNDVASERFSIADANALFTFANNNAWVGMLSFWSANRDNSAASGISQTQWQFSNIFVKFES